MCAASCGPGNLHLINGLFDANRSRVPVLAIAAHIPREEIGGGYFQETHPQELFRECSVYCELVSIPEQFPRVLEIAMRTALEQRGEAVIVVPGEVFLSQSPSTWQVRPVLKTVSVIRPDDTSLGAAAEILNRSGRVTILAGAGCVGAHDRLLAIAAALKAPVLHALRGKEFVEYDNPYDVGMTGLIGFSSGYRAMEHCDALLMLGTRLSLPPVLSSRGPGDPGRRARRSDRSPGARRRRPRGHGGRHDRRPASPPDGEDGHGAPRRDDGALRAGTDALGPSRHRRSSRVAAPSPVLGRHNRPARC